MAWKLWSGTASVISPHGIERTPDQDGGMYVVPVSVDLDAAGDLACAWRDGDVW